MIQANSQKKIGQRRTISATQVVASSIGVIGGGLAGIVHGFFAMLQGNVNPGNIVINPIGPAQRLWPGAALHAISIVPNFFITGICAMIVGLLIVIWAGVFIDKKYGTRVLLLL
jgi:hypothetical protein